MWNPKEIENLLGPQELMFLNKLLYLAQEIICFANGLGSDLVFHFVLLNSTSQVESSKEPSLDT
jgi:hypothetical protein